jgi:hypothetical protein
MLSDASFTSHSYDVYSPSGKGINIAELERREKEEADRRAQEEVDRKLKLIEERKKSLPKIDMTKKLDPPGASWYIYFLFFFSLELPPLAILLWTVPDIFCRKKVDTAEGSS